MDTDGERQAVLAVVQRLFDAMHAKDAKALSDVLHPQARFSAVPDSGGGDAVKASTRDELIQRTVADTESLLERMWDPEVRIDDPIATVWAPYEFVRGGEFLHCGTDSVQLVKGEEGWTILAAFFTMHPKGQCPPGGPE